MGMDYKIDEPMHYFDEPTYVDEPTYGEEKYSDMDYKIDEPMHYVDEPTYYVDEPTYGEEKHSDMDYKIDEPMHFFGEPTYVDEPTYGEKKHSDDMSFLKTTEKEAAKAEEAKEVAEDMQFEKKPVEKTRSEGKPNLRAIAEKKRAAKAIA